MRQWRLCHDESSLQKGFSNTEVLVALTRTFIEFRRTKDDLHMTMGIAPLLDDEVLYSARYKSVSPWSIMRVLDKTLLAGAKNADFKIRKSTTGRRKELWLLATRDEGKLLDMEEVKTLFREIQSWGPDGHLREEEFEIIPAHYRMYSTLRELFKGSGEKVQRFLELYFAFMRSFVPENRLYYKARVYQLFVRLGRYTPGLTGATLLTEAAAGVSAKKKDASRRRHVPKFFQRPALAQELFDALEDWGQDREIPDFGREAKKFDPYIEEATIAWWSEDLLSDPRARECFPTPPPLKRPRYISHWTPETLDFIPLNNFAQEEGPSTSGGSAS